MFRSVGRQVLLPSIWALSSAVAAGQGFNGLSGKFEVTFTRKRPPVVYLTDTEIAVRGTSEVSAANDLVPRVVTTLETGLLNGDSRFKRNADAPQVVISVTVTHLDTNESTTSRVVPESKKVGQHQETDSKTGKTKTVDDYSTVNVTHTYKVVAAHLNAACQVKAARTSDVIDATNVGVAFNHEYENGAGAPTTDEVHANLIQQLTDRIAQRLVPTSEPLQVLLAKDSGKARSGNDLARAGLWTKALESWSLLKPYARPDDDAYRLYNIGVAYEAMAYQAEDLDQSRKFLDQASVDYSDALAKNPSEKYFVEPQARIGAAIAAYKKLADQQDIWARTLKAREAPAVQTASAGSRDLTKDSAQPAQKPSDSFGNEQVISLAKKGLDDDNLIAAIREEKAVKFDLSADGLAELLDAKISNRVISAMRARQATVTSSKPAAPKTASVPAKPVATTSAKPPAPARSKGTLP